MILKGSHRDLLGRTDGVTTGPLVTALPDWRTASEKGATIGGPRKVIPCMQFHIPVHGIGLCIPEIDPVSMLLRYIVAVAGAPGSGKTSAAHVTCQLLNKLAESAHAIAAVLPMDGKSYSSCVLIGQSISCNSEDRD